MADSDWQVADNVLQSDYKTEKELKDAHARLEIYEALDTVKIRNIPAYKPKRGSSTAVALLSDCHIEERVDQDDVPGCMNAYNPEIAKRRFEQFFQRVVYITDAQRHVTNITDICLGILGDIITGHLHDDQRESNYMSPTRAILLAEEMISSGLEYILSNGNYDKIIIPCAYGNHGRTTSKPRHKTAKDNNLEWMLYQHLAKSWKKEKRIDWHIANGSHIYLDIAGYVCRFHHGDNVRYNGGVGGLSIPLLKAIGQWNKVRRADYDFLGHYHTCRDFGFAVVNGSLVGYNAYALNNKCDFERPKQAYVLIDHKRGKSAMFDIWTDYMPCNAKDQRPEGVCS